MALPAEGSFALIEPESPYPGVVRRSFDSSAATVTRYWFEPCAAFPMHRHAQEQITLVEEGEVEFAVGGDARTLRAGEWSIVAPGVEHGLQAGRHGARILAIVVPARDRRDPYTVVAAAS